MKMEQSTFLPSLSPIIVSHKNGQFFHKPDNCSNEVWNIDCEDTPWSIPATNKTISSTMQIINSIKYNYKDKFVDSHRYRLNEINHSAIHKYLQSAAVDNLWGTQKNMLTRTRESKSDKLLSSAVLHLCRLQPDITLLLYWARYTVLKVEPQNSFQKWNRMDFSRTKT